MELLFRFYKSPRAVASPKRAMAAGWLSLAEGLWPRRRRFVVLELDSWQLQSFGDAKISPNVSVFTEFDARPYELQGDMKDILKIRRRFLRIKRLGKL